MKIIYSGFDKVEFSVQGNLSREVLDALETHRTEAEEQRSMVLATLGPGQLDAHVHDSGMKGGYRYRLDTGPCGVIVACKNNTNPNLWNLSVVIRAASLATMGLDAALTLAWDTLEKLGATVLSHSVRRIDYAMDIRMAEWDLRLDSFVAHSRTTIHPHWGHDNPQPKHIDLEPDSIIRGKRIETVALGRMPGRAVCVYDKRRKITSSPSEAWWYKVWGIDPKTPDQEIMRVELRAGKRELKDKWQIVTFDDVRNSLADVFDALTKDVRYLARHQSDSNVKRQRLDPVWELVRTHLDTGLGEMRSGLTRDQFKEVTREQAQSIYEAQITGNAAGLVVAFGLTPEEAETGLPELLRVLGSQAINDSTGHFQERIRRAEARLRFKV